MDTKQEVKRAWVCDECGKRMTQVQAARAMSRGCNAGCSGIDIHEVLEEAKAS